MTTPELGTLSGEDLEKMDENIRKERARRHEERLNTEIAALREIAEERGYLVEEIFSARRVPAAPKYQHPTNPSQTWSGRGRRPDWLNGLLRAGHDLDGLKLA